MGIGGHMLGAKKLRKLSALTGLNLSRAYIRGPGSEGVVWHEDGTHSHYYIDPKTGQHKEDPHPMHWVSCDEGRGMT